MIKKSEVDLLNKIFRGYIASLESEKYRAETEKGKAFPWYDSEIEKARELQKRVIIRG